MRATKKIQVCIIAILLGAGAGIQPCMAQKKIIAVANNEVITQKDLEDFTRFMRIQLSQQYQGKELEAKMQSMKLDLVDKLIEDRLILQEAKKNKVAADANQVKAKLEEIKKRYGSNMAFQDAIATQGLVEADIEERLKEQMSMYEFIQQKIKSRIIVKPEEVTEFFNTHKEEFVVGPQREFESVAARSMQAAEGIRAQLQAGKTMQEVAEADGLSVTSITSSRQELKKEIGDAVFGLKEGQVSQPLRIEGAYYIFRLTRIIASRSQEISEVQDAIYRLLFEMKFQEDLRKWLDEVKKNSYIKIF
ncbi:MAG: peptidyl-prolyl cis-trans isomerase [Candidatus Omnitrophica bacterium]|nr:peptidyl-prolyl cis-trans isomerase [Candidatus Omnitrophota bacterium]